MKVLFDKNQNLAQLYDRDYSLWLETTADLLKQGQLSQLDIPNLIEEIEDMGKRDKKALESNLEILIMHLLKYKYQSEKRTNSWRYTIIEHRNRIAKSFKYSPSLEKYCGDVLAECYQVARKFATNESGLSIDTFPEQCCFSLEQVLDENYLPFKEPSA
jgi:hypothetical protein